MSLCRDKEIAAAQRGMILGDLQIYNLGIYVDTSIYIEPIRTRQAKGKSDKVSRSVKRQAAKQAKIDQETVKAAGRLAPLLYQKYNGELKVALGQSTLDRLADDPSAVSTADKRREIYARLFDLLDNDGLVNHRVIRDRAERLSIISVVFEQALEAHLVDIITRVIWVKIVLPRSQMAIQRVASAERTERLESRRKSRRSRRAA